MSRVKKFIVLILLAAIAGAALYFLWFSGLDRSNADGAPLPPQSGKTLAEHQKDQSSTGKVRHSKAAPNEATLTQNRAKEAPFSEHMASQAAGEAVDLLSAGSRGSEGEKWKSDASETTDYEDRSVIGRPVKISPSVQTKCKEESAVIGDEDSFCEAAFQLVKKMVGEPRDLKWAPMTESLLQGYVHAIESEIGEIVMRNLECRKSICILEVASQYGELKYHAYGHPASFDLIDRHRLHGEVPIIGREVDGYHNDITVTFLVFDLLGPKQPPQKRQDGG